MDNTESMARKGRDIKILLLSRNHVVRDMVKLAAEKSGVAVDTIETPQELKEDRCDLLLVDGISPVPIDLPQKCIKRGDRLSLSISAASIVAINLLPSGSTLSFIRSTY